jgi:hypothetical protein
VKDFGNGFSIENAPCLMEVLVVEKISKEAFTKLMIADRQVREKKRKQAEYKKKMQEIDITNFILEARWNKHKRLRDRNHK